MVPYLTGAIAGAAYGIVIGYIKSTVLWKKVLKSEKKISTGALYLRLGVSYTINVLTLLFVFLMRDEMPWNFPATLLGAAVTLSLAGKLAPISQIMNHVEEKTQ